MLILNKIYNRFRIVFKGEFFMYLLLLMKSDKKLRKHFKTYYHYSLLKFFFGKYWYVFSNYDRSISVIQNNYLDCDDLDLRLIYYGTNVNDILSILNNGNEDLLSLYGLKFKLINEYNFKIIMIYELRDLIIPYIVNKHLLYNKTNIGEGTYESENVFISEGDVVFDVGANVGVFSIFALKHTKLSSVFAFEPISQNYDILKLNLVNNQIYDNAKIFNIALSDYIGYAQMQLSSDNMGAHSMIFLDNDLVNVVTTTLDEFVNSNNITKIDFIKVDIEGSERLFINGARDSIKRFLPKISICTYHLYDDPLVLTNQIKSINPNYHFEYYSKKLYAWIPSKT